MSLEQFFGAGLTVVDLTQPISRSSPFWPSGDAMTPFRYEVLRAQPSGAPAMGAYYVPEHFGTHLDAPVHSADGLKSVDQLTPNDLFGPAVVVNVEDEGQANPDYRLTVDDLLGWEEMYGTIPDHAVVLMRTGWDTRWGDPDSYRNMDSSGQMHFPGFSSEAAEFLMTERNINGIGIDDFSVDAATADGFPVHGIVNGRGHFHLENLSNLDRLPEAGAYLIVAPIKIQGGSGGQVRVFGLVPAGNS